jgi:predicted nucleic acid-binding protein
MQKVCIDTGILNNFLSNSPTKEISSLFQKIRSAKLEAYIPKEILIELFKHLCRKIGIESAKDMILAFLNSYPVILFDLTVDLIVKAGSLKCQTENLSYNDCILIAYALSQKIPLHSTDKTLDKVPNSIIQRLIVVKYRF